ncbi:Hypothetical protein A7982_04500 [Minicystis rosea]|nr:Hypothetical protein A7982_04500 [Minicystis rosea]
MESPPVEAAPTAPAPRAPRRFRRLRVAAQIALGLAVSLGLTEAVFRKRDGAAFPLVNVYERDTVRGVRLSPGSVTAVGRPGERTTHVRINAEGYRGAEWPSASSGEVIVVGDSLSFGLGVEEDEALAARLHASLPSAPAVLDASVPTYGPPEYLATMKQILDRRRPATVVLVINLMNDLVEVHSPNRERHTAVDGWAARVDGSAAPRSSSALRTRLIQRSHAAFALWRWLRTREAAASNITPEPGFDDLLKLGARVAGEVQRDGAHRAEEARRAAALVAAQVELREAQRDVLAVAERYRSLVSSSQTLSREWESYLRSAGDPHDEIFRLGWGGCVPPPRGREYGRYARFRGDRIRTDVEHELGKLARAFPGEIRDAIDGAFARRRAAEARLAALPTAPLPPPAARSPLPIAPMLAEAQSLAAAHGASLAVVVAPLDAQVSESARRRRDLGEADATALTALTVAVAVAARAAGAVGIDATPALEKAGPAAFLEDGHLSAAGHEALARAVTEALHMRSARE